MRGVGDNPHANRPIVELFSLYVACDDCGHQRVLDITRLKQANDLGVYNYRQLCQKIRCGECPPAPPRMRNLTIRPTWVQDRFAELQAVS